MKKSKLIKFFEDNDFKVYLFEQDGLECAELESWTNGGVDMIIELIPFSENEFIDYVEAFDIDEEIDINRQNKDYCKAFRIRESVNDFEDYYKRLLRLSNKLNKKR